MRLPSFLPLSLVGLIFACQTSKSDQPEKPEITRDMPLSEAYAHGRLHGGDVLQKVKELAKERKELPALQKMSENDLIKHNESYSPTELSNASNAYVFAGQRIEPAVLKTLLESRSDSAQKLGWRLAAIKPSAAVAKTIEEHLEKAMKEGREDEVLSPEMAVAIQENGMKSEFSFLSRGLLIHGNPEYANAMLQLDPKSAANPFLTYLTRADLEDLRQLNQKSVNVYTCTAIFRYLMDNSFPISHPGVPSIFLFAVSRNRGLAEMANAVLEKHIPEQRTTFAMMLARLPVPVQVAFIENSQREMTANLRLLLSELKEVGQQKEVLEELNSPQAAGAQ